MARIWRASRSATCPMCGAVCGLHYVLGAMCPQLFCNWVSCRDCGLVMNLDTGDVRRAGSWNQT